MLLRVIVDVDKEKDMGELFERYDVEAVKGKDITIGDRFLEVFISDTDEVFCYPGICLND